MTHAIRIEVSHDRFALAHPFRISRGVKTHADVVTVRLTLSDGRSASAECVPYARYGESVEGVIDALTNGIPMTTCREALDARSLGLHGAARNALETALFALDHPGECAGALAHFRATEGAGTLVIDTPALMAERAEAFPFAVAKLKLQGDGDDLERLRRVATARPDLPLWLDANEGFSADVFDAFVDGLGRAHGPAPLSARVILVEQPFRAGEEVGASMRASTLPICADESFHTVDDVASAKRAGYAAVNVKLDKAGGLPSAERAAHAAHEAGLLVALGCMVSSSLSIAAAVTLRRRLEGAGIPVPFVDLDGATFLSNDRSLEGTGWG